MMMMTKTAAVAVADGRRGPGVPSMLGVGQIYSGSGFTVPLAQIG